jgi:hypothetical protein
MELELAREHTSIWMELLDRHRDTLGRCGGATRDEQLWRSGSGDDGVRGFGLM